MPVLVLGSSFRSFAYVSALGLAATVALACDGNHSDLAASGGGGATSAATSTASSASSGSTSSSGGSGGSIPVEPSGPLKLTVVNGLVDAPSATFCFVPSPSGTLGRPPFPVGGLDFGHALVLDKGTADVPDSDVNLVAISGALDPKVSCDELLANPDDYPDNPSVQLGLIPKQALTQPRSLALLFTGCFGGDTHTDENQTQICGVNYAPDAPTASISFVPLSRIADSTHVNLQVVNGVTALSKLTFYFLPGFSGSMSSDVEDSLSFGAIAPYPPNASLTVSDIGPGASAMWLVSLPQNASQIGGTALSQMIGKGGAVAADIANGKNLAFVALGPSPAVNTGADSWWQPFTFVALAAQ